MSLSNNLTIVGDQSGIDPLRLKDHLFRFGYKGAAVSLSRDENVVSIKETGQKIHLLDLSPFIVKFSWPELGPNADFESYGGLVAVEDIDRFIQSDVFKHLEEDEDFYGDYYRETYGPFALINEVRYRFIPGIGDNTEEFIEDMNVDHYYYIETGYLSLNRKEGSDYENTRLGEVLTLQPDTKGWRIHWHGEFCADDFV